MNVTVRRILFLRPNKYPGKADIVSADVSFRPDSSCQPVSPGVLIANRASTYSESAACGCKFRTAL